MYNLHCIEGRGSMRCARKLCVCVFVARVCARGVRDEKVMVRVSGVCVLCTRAHKDDWNHCKAGDMTAALCESTAHEPLVPASYHIEPIVNPCSKTVSVCV